MKTKMQTSLENLCKEFPNEVENFLHYTRDLMFDEKPDYNYLYKLLKDICDKNNIQVDNIFDWNIIHNNINNINENKIRKKEENKNSFDYSDDKPKNKE